MKEKRPYTEMMAEAQRIKSLLEPHCERIEIAGSLRRECDLISDIELVAIPKPYDTGLFEDGLASVVNQWEKVKGEMDYEKCKYTQRILPSGIKLDLFFAQKGNWGNILAIRTGSADYSHKVLATEWVKQGYKSENGFLTRDGKYPIMFYEEEDLFKFLGLKYIHPRERSL